MIDVRIRLHAMGMGAAVAVCVVIVVVRCVLWQCTVSVRAGLAYIVVNASGCISVVFPLKWGGV